MLFSAVARLLLVDMEVPSGCMQFLRLDHAQQAAQRAIHHARLQAQGKTMFFRDLVSHLRHPTTSSSSHRASAAW